MALAFGVRVRGTQEASARLRRIPPLVRQAFRVTLIEQLEQALDTFAGTVILVTHDRALLGRVRLTRTFELTDGHVTERARSA